LSQRYLGIHPGEEDSEKRERIKMDRQKVIILGGGGIATIASWIMDRRGDAEAVGLINDMVPVGESIGTRKKLQVVGTSEDVAKYIYETDYQFFIAFHGMQKEKEVYKKVCDFNIPRERLYSPIDPTAVIAYDYSEIGRGVLAAPYAQIGPDVVIKDYTVVLGNAFIGHDTNVGEFCHIASNAVLGAFNRIGNACHIGMNATLRQYVQVGDYSLIGMGAVVLNDVEESTIVVGNPAHLLRKKEE